jgi:hypothetical protein
MKPFDKFAPFLALLFKHRVKKPPFQVEIWRYFTTKKNITYKALSNMQFHPHNLRPFDNQFQGL